MPQTREQKRAADKAYYERNREKRQAYAREYYQRNREKVITRVLGYREEINAIITEAKRVPCADCGTSFPMCCMQFHHLDPATKVGDVGNLGHPTTVRKELAKCVVICANCHCIRHDRETR